MRREIEPPDGVNVFERLFIPFRPIINDFQLIRREAVERDFRRRQRVPGQKREIEFPPVNKRLGKALAAGIRLQSLQRLPQIGRLFRLNHRRLRQADRRMFPDRFDDVAAARNAAVVLRVLQPKPFRRGNLRGAQIFFGDQLVRGQKHRFRSRARVREFQRVQQGRAEVNQAPLPRHRLDKIEHHIRRKLAQLIGGLPQIQRERHRRHVMPRLPQRLANRLNLRERILLVFARIFERLAVKNDNMFHELFTAEARSAPRLCGAITPRVTPPPTGTANRTVLRRNARWFQSFVGRKCRADRK